MSFKESNLTVTKFVTSQQILIETSRDKGRDKTRAWLSFDNYRKILEHGEKIFEKDIEFEPVDWEKKESQNYFGFNIEETGVEVENHVSGRLKCKCCGKGIKRIRNFLEEEMEEPRSNGDDVCINEFGFHDHHTSIWWQFTKPRTSPDRFKNDLTN